MEAICVAVRVRPLKEDAVVAGTGRGNFWRVGNNSISLHAPNGIQVPGYSFTFDHVFGDDSRNASIYEAHTKDVIQAAVHGFNGTVFAYGQTSSGKTYTMQGSDADPGIIRLAVNNVFQRIQTISDREFLIRVSYLEIYNEEINDLLFPENKKLQVHENLERGIFVAGLREEIVNNPEQVFELIELGEAHRHVGETNMNVRSSRSHTIFRMVIESRGKNVDSNGNLFNKDAVRVSVLNLVDLAGSERVSKTGAGGVRLKEGTHINKSLMSLGTVINKLSDGSGKNRGHIPYRDSKLTRILQPALGGNAKTAIICTVAPEEVHTDETRGTLQFASRAKKVTNCAQVNEIVTDAALLKRQKREIEDLKRKLEGSHSEVLEQEILKLRNEMLKFELERERLAMELEEERKAQLERDRRIMEQQMKIDNLSTLVINSDQERNSFRSSGADNAYPRKLSQDFSEKERYKEGSVERRVTLRREKFSLHSESDVSCSDESKRFSSRMSDRNSLPSDFENVADEDTWMTLNGGQIMTDLDFLQPSPFKKSLSVRSGVSSGPAEQYQVEIENLKQELQKALQEKNEAEQSLEHQISLNDELNNALTVMESEAMVIGDISQKIAKVMIESKEDQKEMSSYFKSLPLEDKQGCRIVDFKSNFLQLVKLLDEYKQENEHLHQQCQILDKQLKHAVASLMLNNNEQKSKNKGHGNMLYKDTSSDFPSSVVVSFKPGTSTIGGSNMQLIPCQETFKDICNKVCCLDAMDGQAAAIDIAALCSTLSDSKAMSDFVKALQTSQSSEVFDNMDTSEDCVKLEKLEANVVGNIFLAKWLIREMTNLAKYRDFLHSSSKVTMCGNYQKNMKTLRACLKQMKEAAESLPYLQDPEVCHFEDENISLEHQDLQTKCAYLWERLQMSSEHILSLDNKIALLSIEKDTIAKALDREFQRQEQRELEHGFLMEQHRQISAKLAARRDTYSRIHCHQRISDEEFQIKSSLLMSNNMAKAVDG